MAEVITTSEAEAAGIRDSAVSIGVFDGFHTGHQEVIRQLLASKQGCGARHSVLITFDRHPLSVIAPERRPRLLTTLEEKISLLSMTEVDLILVETFDHALAEIDYRDFVTERLITRLGMRYLVTGYDFHLGKGREGDQQNLARLGAKLGFGFSVVPPVVVRGRAVSSTRIRGNIEKRKLRRAARLLTRPYFFDARVVRGRGVGRGLGYPTANVSLPAGDKLVPPPGVYAVRARVDGEMLSGMMNVGEAPTMRLGGPQSVEVHLFDFEGELYDRQVRVFCHEWMREERKFEGPDGLSDQLSKDRLDALAILEKNH